MLNIMKLKMFYGCIAVKFFNWITHAKLKLKPRNVTKYCVTDYVQIHLKFFEERY